MRKSFILLLLAILTIGVNAQKLERVEPMFWWAGMHNPKLQLLVHGTDIGSLEAKINYPGVRLAEIHKVENPNYLFLDLEISAEAKAGKFLIVFNKNGKKNN